MFRISTEDINIVGNVSKSFAILSEVLQGDMAAQIGENIIAMFANPFMEITELFGKFVTDMAELFTAPIIDNIDQIKETFEGLLEPIKTVTDTLAEAFTYVGDTLTDIYDNHISPFFDNLKEGLSDSFGKFLDVYNQYFAPFVKETADDIKELWDKSLKPLWDKVTELVKSIIDDVLMPLWVGVLKPIIDWVIQNVLPILVPILRGVKDVIVEVVKVVSALIGSLLDVIKGIIKFISGVFTADWKKAWEGVKSIFKGVIDGLVAIFKFPLNLIIDGINNFTKSLKSIKIPDWVPAVGGKSISIPKIPRLAEGGMPEVGQMFIANEKGAELVGNIGGQSFVANQNQMLDIIDKKLQNSGGLQNATFVIQIGDEQIAKKVLKDLNGMAKSNGKPITIRG